MEKKKNQKKNYLGDNIIELRRKNGLAQEGFAEKLGVTRQMVSKWEKGMAVPRSSKIKKICEEFNVSADELLDNKPAQENKNESRPVARKKSKMVLTCTAIILIFLFVVYIIY